MRTRHYPSSWYNNATNPVRPPTSTGIHAAATGDRSSDLLMSSVIFDSTNKQEAGGDAAQHHLLHAAEAEEAQAHRSRKHHHGGEEERARQQLLILQPITRGAEAGAIGHFDVGGKLPERHGFRRGKAFPHLLEGQIGAEPVAVLDAGGFAAGVDARFVEPPVALLQRGASRLDPLLEMAGAVEGEHADAAELRALLAARYWR